MLSWTGAAAVLWLWWHNTPAVAATTAERMVNAGRITVRGCSTRSHSARPVSRIAASTTSPSSSEAAL
ncbi:hypothetical protein [Streptomyces sp. SAI-144]|uniref:hypothetical protein n=1 Tax=Streptomyces sp. SAI-144 TaxID=2940544 RepID=UPI0024731B87|nr:hypothetical protein [Streptomyces sp. SAI-144]